jgi:O-antigen/teichoic acid export membrane protein
LIPSYGIVGASIASGTSLAVYVLALLIEVYVLLKMHPYNIKFIWITLFGLASFGISYFMKYVLAGLDNPLKIIVSLILFLTIYIGFIFKQGIDDEDKILVNVFKDKLLKVIA